MVWTVFVLCGELRPIVADVLVRDLGVIRSVARRFVVVVGARLCICLSGGGCELPLPPPPTLAADAPARRHRVSQRRVRCGAWFRYLCEEFLGEFSDDDLCFAAAGLDVALERSLGYLVPPTNAGNATSHRAMPPC